MSLSYSFANTIQPNGQPVQVVQVDLEFPEEVDPILLRMLRSCFYQLFAVDPSLYSVPRHLLQYSLNPGVPHKLRLTIVLPYIGVVLTHDLLGRGTSESVEGCLSEILSDKLLKEACIAVLDSP